MFRVLIFSAVSFAALSSAQAELSLPITEQTFCVCRSFCMDYGSPPCATPEIVQWICDGASYLDGTTCQHDGDVQDTSVSAPPAAN